MLIPYVVDSTKFGERSYDIYSRLLEDRIIFLTGEITTEVANTVIAELLYLEGKDNEKPVSLYINSPGGIVDGGLAIMDTMNYIKCKVNTICVGLAASMSAVLLACGNERFALKNSRIMIHQPLGGCQGQASDIKIQADEILKMRAKLNEILAEKTNKNIEQIEKDTNRDNYFSSVEALAYGLIDKILEERK